jgi:hypothetical protein
MKLFLNIFCFIFLVSHIHSQQFSPGSPEWLVDMFFSKANFPDKADYYTGEMLNDVNERTIGEELNGKGEISFHQIKAANDQIAFAVDVNQNENTIEFYCYLIKQADTWKINAVRRFLLPSFIYSVRDSLSQLNKLTSNDSTFLISLRLFTASDSELKNHLTINLNRFQELVLSFNNNQKDQADKILEFVSCNAIYSDRKYPGCIFIQVLKFEDMEVGFINATDAMLLPKISIDDFIYIEAVAQGWYLFRVM